MPNMPWFRFYSETLNDRKIRRLCTATGLTKATVIGTWSIILAMANDSPERGKLKISDDLWVTQDEIREETGLEPMDYNSLMGGFFLLGMLDTESGTENIVVSNWDGRQFKSDHSSPRVAKHRAEKKRQEEEQAEQDCNVTPALQEQPSGVIDTEADTDTELEKETDSEVEKDPFVASAPAQAITTLANYQMIRLAYINEFPDKAVPRPNTKSLVSKVRTRMKYAHFADSWLPALVRAGQSDLLHRSGWFDLGWFLKNDNNYEKCLNGNYDNDSRIGLTSPPSTIPDYDSQVDPVTGLY